MPDPDQIAAIRLDKWLWAARFFKTRALANEAVTGGKVHVNGSRAKPAKAVRVGDELSIQRGGSAWTVVVHELAELRRGAPDAARLYVETEASKRARAERATERHAFAAPEPGGRPSKHARRALERLRRGGRP